MTTRINPTFLLKGLDPNKILADYNAGFFSRPIVPKSKIKIAQNTAILAPTYGTSNKDPIFSVKDRNNCSIIIATSNHANYEVFTRTGGSVKIGGRCDRCKRDFPHAVMGYPLAYQETTILTNDDPDPKNAHYRILYTFWVEGEFCSFECTLEWIRLFLACPSDYRDTTLRDSEHMLHTLFKLMHPTAGILRPSNDPLLLRRENGTGGSLTEEQWKDQRHIYVRTDRILMIPAKVEYIQQNFTNPVMSIDYSRDLNTITT